MNDLKVRYNKLLRRWKSGIQYVEKDYAKKYHDAVIGIGEEMDAVLDTLESIGIEISDNEYQQGFKIQH